MTKCILVLGAVLLDIIGKASSDHSDAQDKIGNIEFAVGGVAFNVAVNLTSMGYECQLFTCLRENSPISRLLKSSIANTGVKLDYIIEESHIPDAAFMAIFSGAPMSALTSSPIDRINILASGKLKAAIAQARMVIIDTNLSPEQIKTVHNLCADAGVDLCVVSASDAKASRIAESRDPSRIFSLVAMNEREARAMGIGSEEKFDHRTVLDELSSERVLLSQGPSGALYMDNLGVHHIPAPPNIVPVNTIGAGDALFSAICSCVLERRPPYKGDGLAVVTDAVSQVLGKTGPNMGDSKIAFTSTNNKDTITGVLLVMAELTLYYIGLTIGLQGVAEHWVSTIAASALAGAIGTWIYNTLKDNRRETSHLISGFVVGLASAAIGSLPSLAGGDLVDPEKLSQAQMVVHFLSSTAFSLLAGLGLSRAVDRLFNQALTG